MCIHLCAFIRAQIYVVLWIFPLILQTFCNGFSVSHIRWHFSSGTVDSIAHAILLIIKRFLLYCLLRIWMKNNRFRAIPACIYYTCRGYVMYAGEIRVVFINLNGPSLTVDQGDRVFTKFWLYSISWRRFYPVLVEMTKLTLRWHNFGCRPTDQVDFTLTTFLVLLTRFWLHWSVWRNVDQVLIVNLLIKLRWHRPRFGCTGQVEVILTMLTISLPSGRHCLSNWQHIENLYWY